MAETISWITGYGFCVFLVGSLSWLVAGVLTDQPALMWTNIVLTILNVFGIWRWLGRQARIEEGASVGASESEQMAGESLFPVSLLLKVQVVGGDGKPLGTCVDAMAGRDSGAIRYVVVSEGGVAGVGETLRRLPWDRGRVDSNRLVVEAGGMDGFDRIAKDEWPAR
jgi:hypothetical protein